MTKKIPYDRLPLDEVDALLKMPVLSMSVLRKIATERFRFTNDEVAVGREKLKKALFARVAAERVAINSSRTDS